MTALTVRAIAGPGSSGLLIFLTTAASLILDVAAAPLGLHVFLASSVSVSDADAKAIGKRIDALFPEKNIAGPASNIVLMDICRALWVALADARAADGDSSEIHRGQLEADNAQLIFDAFAESSHFESKNDKGVLLKFTGVQLRNFVMLVFDLFDRDADGKLTFKEFTTGFMTVSALFMLRGIEDEELRTDYTFTCLDLDDSGFLEPDELVAFATIIRKLGGVLPEERSLWYSPLSPEGLANEWMKAADVNNDGKISREEFNKILGPRIQFATVLERLIPGKLVNTDPTSAGIPLSNLSLGAQAKK